MHPVLSRLPVVAASAAPIALADSVVSDEHIAFVVLLVGTVTTVAGLMAWIDYRIEKKNRAQTRLVMNEIRHLRQMLALKLEAPELADLQIELDGGE
jgi:hypothetical protein